MAGRGKQQSMSRIEKLLSTAWGESSEPVLSLVRSDMCSCHLGASGFSRADIPVNSLKTRRVQRGLTQAQLALAVGASRQLISAIEARKCLPSLPLAFKMTRVFSTSNPRPFRAAGGQAVET